MKNRWVVIALAASTASASPIVYAQSAGRALTFVPAPGGMLVEPTIPLPPKYNGIAISGPNVRAAADLRGDGRKDLVVGMVVNPTQPPAPTGGWKGEGAVMCAPE